MVCAVVRVSCGGVRPGIDRHLLGLRLIAAEQGVEEPGLYKDPAYSRISTWRLSTSQLTSPHFQVCLSRLTSS